MKESRTGRAMGKRQQQQELRKCRQTPSSFILGMCNHSEEDSEWVFVNHRISFCESVKWWRPRGGIWRNSCDKVSMSAAHLVSVKKDLGYVIPRRNGMSIMTASAVMWHCRQFLASSTIRQISVQSLNLKALSSSLATTHFLSPLSKENRYWKHSVLVSGWPRPSLGKFPLTTCGPHSLDSPIFYPLKVLSQFL